MGVIGGGSLEEEDVAWERISLIPLMATLLLPIVIGAVLIIKCLFGNCCAKGERETKDEMYGVEGKMTMLSHSDGVDASFMSPPCSPVSPTSEVTIVSSEQCALLESGGTASAKAKAAATSVSNNNANNSSSEVTTSANAAMFETNFVAAVSSSSEGERLDSLKRGAGKRQLPDLPDIPRTLGNPPRRSSSVVSHDGTSELYATVGDVPNPYAHLKTRHSVPNEHILCQPSTSRGVKVGNGRDGAKNSLEPNPSSDSETYAATSSSHHPYAKLKKNTAEHPYARVRKSNANANDEETDTDNYDMPQPYAQTRRPGNTQGESNPGGDQSHGPVPPRRVGRQWRRGSNSQVQNSVDSASHFSGDSQDSRGYTSISVREPLSNIRNQLGGNRGDSHYATVSDDSEEMYAAIDDSSDGNYMQILDQDRPNRPTWLDAANMASPIPERREANSPLPPVPLVPPPLDNPAVPVSPSQHPPQSPPLYAQVTKKSKKAKAPVTPTVSNSSTSSQVLMQQLDKTKEVTSERGEPEGSLSSVAVAHSSSSHHAHSHFHHHRNKSRTLMDNNNLLESNERRWSKADISYSEFEIVRETLTDVPKSPISSSAADRSVSPRESSTGPQTLSQDILDEDNYNVIPERHRPPETSKRSRNRVDSENYQELEPISNTYQEIERKEPSDHYQEIGGLPSFPNGDDNDSGSGLYQEIRKRDEEEELEEEEDQFYETVKPAVKSHSNTTQSSSNRKHGYEKLMGKKAGATTNNVKSTGPISDDEEEYDDEDRLDEDDEMYEKMKYPPYERLQESRSDLTVNDGEDDEEGSNFYEHIGYSRVKPKHKKSSSTMKNDVKSAKAEETSEQPLPEQESDLNQLYAVVDKTKKKRGKGFAGNHSHGVNNNNPQNYNNNNPSENTSLKSSETLPYSNSSGVSLLDSSSRNIGLSTSTKAENFVTAGPDFDYIDDTNDIEYI